MAGSVVDLPSLSLGSVHPSVLEAQRLLDKAGLWPTGMWGKIEPGVFGPLTQQAVAAFQTKYNLRGDTRGSIGPETWTNLYVVTGEAKVVQQGTAVPGASMPIPNSAPQRLDPRLNPVPALQKQSPAPVVVDTQHSGLMLKVLLGVGVAGAAYYFYKKSQPKLVVGGYDDAGPVLSMRRAAKKYRRSMSAHALGSKGGRGVEPGEGAPAADVQKGYNPRARRFLRRQREMYPVLAPDVVAEKAHERLRRPEVTKEEYETMTAAEKREMIAADAAMRAKWERAGHKRGPVGPGKGVIESDPREGTARVELERGAKRGRKSDPVRTMTVVNERNVERFLTLPRLSPAERARMSKEDRAILEEEDRAHRKLLIKAGAVPESDEEDAPMIPIVEEVAIDPGRAPAVIRLEADEKMWKQQHRYRNDMKQLAWKRAQANSGSEVQVVVRGTHRTLYKVKDY